MKVMTCQCQTLQEVVDMASHFEDEYNTYKESQPKRKANMTVPRFFVSRVPSSDSSRNSGKKTKVCANTSFSGRYSFAGRRSARFSQAGSSGGPQMG